MKRISWSAKRAAELFACLDTRERVNSGINVIIEYLGQEEGKRVLKLVYEHAVSHGSKCNEFIKQYLSRREGSL